MRIREHGWVCCALACVGLVVLACKGNRAPAPTATTLVATVPGGEGGFFLSSMTTDDTDVYWATSVGPTQVGRVSKSGGTGVSVASIPLPKMGTARGIAAAGAELFVLTPDEGDTSTLWSVPKTGGSPRAVVLHEALRSSSPCVDADMCIVGVGSHVSWLGGAVRTLDAHGEATSLVPDQPGARALATDGTSLFWTSDAPSSTIVRSVALTGGPVTELGKVAGVQLGIAVDATHVYLGGDDVVWSLPKAGGSVASQKLARAPGVVHGGGSRVQWRTGGKTDDGVAAATTSSGKSTMLFEWSDSSFQLEGLTADEHAVYVLGLKDAKTPTLYRLAPP